MHIFLLSNRFKKNTTLVLFYKNKETVKLTDLFFCGLYWVLISVNKNTVIPKGGCPVCSDLNRTMT